VRADDPLSIRLIVRLLGRNPGQAQRRFRFLSGTVGLLLICVGGLAAWVEVREVTVFLAGIALGLMLAGGYLVVAAIRG